MKNKLLSKLSILALTITPSLLMAANSVDDAFELIDLFKGILNSLIPILMGLGLILFIYGITKYVIAEADVDKSEAIGLITYGIVTMFIMVSIWGIVNYIDFSFFGD